jgi:flavin-dependent dehydrogenase
MIYDIIIVGSGVAGASTAIYLARTGRNVLLIEKETLPRYKPCGGGVIPRALSSSPTSIEPAIQARFSAVQINCLDTEIGRAHV